MGETLAGITGSATDWSTRLHLFVYPVAIGAGAGLWADGVHPTRLRLQDHARYANGVVYLNYGPA